jgi:hypothetical protein
VFFAGGAEGEDVLVVGATGDDVVVDAVVAGANAVVAVVAGADVVVADAAGAAWPLPELEHPVADTAKVAVSTADPTANRPPGPRPDLVRSIPAPAPG